MGRARLKIAIVGCEPRDQEKFRYGNKRYDIRYLVRKKIEAFGEKFEPLVHWPARNKKDFPEIKNIDVVVIPGSKLNVDEETLSEMEWMRKLLDFIADAHEKVPMLGICFGHQAIARVFGSDVKTYGRDIFYEIGFEPTKLTAKGIKDPLFRGIPKEFMGLYSHFQYVADVPDNGVMLAKSGNRKNKGVQAYKIGNATYGVQFHPDYNENHITELVRNRNEIIMKNMPGKRILYFADERHDHKVLANFLDII